KGSCQLDHGALVRYAETDGLNILALLEDREGSVWVGASGLQTGLLCVIQAGRTRCVGENGRLGHGVAALYLDPGGALWVGALNGLWRWTPEAPKFMALPGGTNGIRGITEDDDGALLVSVLEGVRRYDVTRGVPERVALPVDRARRLFRDRDGGLWVAT